MVFGLSFSIPYRIELAVTVQIYVPAQCYIPSFSIPYRIELAVTKIAVMEQSAVTIFQYPLSDRTRCNAVTRVARLLGCMAFSIPYRIELAVTRDAPPVLGVW